MEWERGGSSGRLTIRHTLKRDVEMDILLQCFRVLGISETKKVFGDPFISVNKLALELKQKTRHTAAARGQVQV